MYLNKHACRLYMHFEIFKTWNHQWPEYLLSDTQVVCVWQLVLWLLVVSSNYFTKFHDFSMIIQVFQIPQFSHAWNFFFRDFPWFPELLAVGMRSEGVWILSSMHSNKNVQIFRLSRRSEERHPKFNLLFHECPKSYSVKNGHLCSSFVQAFP